MGDEACDDVYPASDRGAYAYADEVKETQMTMKLAVVSAEIVVVNVDEFVKVVRIKYIVSMKRGQFIWRSDRLRFVVWWHAVS
jgi:hypothetical protein